MKSLGIYFVDEIPLAPQILGSYGSMYTEIYPCKNSILLKKGISRIITFFVLIHELGHHVEGSIFHMFFKLLFRNQKLRYKMYDAFVIESKITSLICRKWM